MSGTSIPTRARQIVRTREHSRCARCGGAGTEWHHRRSRSVRDDHQHCPCNGVLLCATCHRWVHAHPFEARASGMIVSRHSIPTREQMAHHLFGWIKLTCDGAWTEALSYEEEGESM